MKILIVTNLFPNKMEPDKAVFNRQQFRELSKLCKLKIVTPLPFFKYSPAQVPGYEDIDGIDVYHPRYLVIPKILRSLYGFFFFFGVIGKVKDIYKSFKFDIILSSWAYPDGFASALIARILRKPLVIKVHGTDVNEFTRYFLRRKMIVYAFKRAKRIIAVSRALKERITGLGISADKIEVISNAVDTELFKPMDKQWCKKRFFIPSKKKVILYVGNLETVKGVDILISAMHGIASRNIYLVIVGDGSLRDSLRSRVKALGLDKNVAFAGPWPHSEIPLWMNAADVFCLPSRKEGCPNVVLEALSCGIPVVAARTGGIPELIKSEDTGILVEPGSVSEIRSGIQRALEKDWDSNLLRESILNYGWKQNAERVFEELNSAVKKRDIVYHHRTQGTGAEGVHIASIIKGFRKLGSNVYIVSPTGEDPERTAGSNPYAKKQGLVRKFFAFLSRILPQFLFEILELLYNLRAHFRLSRVLKEQRINFIYERYAFFLFAGVRLARKFGIPIILEVNEISGKKRVRKQYFTGLAERIEKYVFKNADAIVVVSDFLKEKIEEYGVSGGKIFVIPNAVDEDVFFEENAGEGLRELFSIESAIVVGFIGWFVEWHNIELLIGAFSRLSDKIRMFLFLVGDGALKEKFKKMARDRGIENRVLFPGSIPYKYMPEYIGLMDICVVPGSNEYRSPIKLFEYMAMGRPVIAPRHKPIESVIEDGNDGILFEPSNERSLEEALETLVKDSGKRQIMGKRAREKIIENHTWLANAKKVMDIYDYARSDL